MKVTDIPLSQLKEAPWNTNRMDPAMLERLKQSLIRFDIVENLVVRRLGNSSYEVLSGNQRLKLLNEIGYSQAPCVVVEVNDAQARLLAQALNHIHGDDDLGLRAALMKEVLETIPESEVLAVLPETAIGLKSLSSLGSQDIATYLTNWNQAQATRLRHMMFQLTKSQEEVVEEALAQVVPVAKRNQGNSPNTRGTALYLLCKAYLERRKDNGS